MRKVKQEFEFEIPNIKADQVKIGKLLGGGGGGQVYECELSTHPDMSLTVKQLKRSNPKYEKISYKEAIQREVTTSMLVYGLPNLVKL